MIAARILIERLGHRCRRLPGNDPAIAQILFARTLHPGNQLFRLTHTTGTGQGQQVMQIGKGKTGIINPRRRFIRQFFPAIANCNAFLLKTAEHGSTIGYVAVIIGLVGTDFPVIQIEHGGMVALFQQVERHMPPDMHLEVIAVLPGRFVIHQPALTGLRINPHLMDMGHGMQTPGIIGIDLQPATAPMLGLVVIRRLLKREGITAIDIARMGMGLVITGQHVFNAPAHPA